ncbi:MAG: FtsQ-type POTRA domain-containing protein [Clostridiales Family XIII bacterium]|jgi:cell division protein FtsQ|nr:FtsQ-type POTRA domain-containing protein [Clostridiales Family XIII bacterium]
MNEDYLYEDFEYKDELTGRREMIRGSRKRKKRRKKHLFLNILILIALLTGVYFLATSNFFEIRTFEVENAAAEPGHYMKEKIVEMSGIQKGTNIFETSMRSAEIALEKDPYIIKASVNRRLPHTVVLTVIERQENFVIAHGNTYAVMDYEGMVLRLTDAPGSLTVVDNLTVIRAEPGTALEVDETALLSQTIAFLKKVEENDLFFKRITASDISVKAYVYDNLICRGSLKNIGDNINSLKGVLLDLRQKEVVRGTVFVGGSGTCTFSPEEDT